MQIEVLDARTLTQADAEAIGEFLAFVWPNPKKSAAVRTRQMLELGRHYAGADEQMPRSFLIREQDRVIAHAAIISRTIGTSLGDLTIAGLAQVCSAPELRGRGLGALVVRAAFEVVDSKVFPFALFQTSPTIQPFYEKLGSCVFQNRIVNSLAEDPEVSPFWDRVAMRYPDTGNWPPGEIDLRGPGF